MLLEWRDQDNFEKGHKEGVESCAKFFSTLFAQGRLEDIKKAVDDPKERARLAAEMGIELPSE